MIFLIAPPVVAALIAAGSSVFNNVMQGRNTRAQLKYNHPVNQVSRVRKAGLPYAALNEKSAGNQSTPTGVDTSGFQEAGRQIGQYQTYKKQIEETKQIQEQINTLKLQNDKLAQELQWYRAGAGTDPARTNLTSMMALEQQIKQGQQVGQGFANTIAELEAKNKPTAISLTNTEQGQRIRNMIQSYRATGEQIEGTKLDNALKSIELQWKPNMKAAEYQRIMQENDISLSNMGLKRLEYELETQTFSNKVAMSNINTALAKMGLEQFGTNYQFNKEYQEIARKARELVTDKEWTWKSLKELPNQLGAWIFTTMSDFSGGGKMPNIPNLGDQSKTFNTYNNIKTE